MLVLLGIITGTDFAKVRNTNSSESVTKHHIVVQNGVFLLGYHIVAV